MNFRKEKVKSVTPGLNNEKDKDGLSLDKIETVDSEEEVSVVSMIFLNLFHILTSMIV